MKKIIVFTLFLLSINSICSAQEDEYIKQLQVKERISAREAELKARKDRRIAIGIERGNKRREYYYDRRYPKYYYPPVIAAYRIPFDYRFPNHPYNYGPYLNPYYWNRYVY